MKKIDKKQSKAVATALCHKYPEEDAREIREKTTILLKYCHLNDNFRSRMILRGKIPDVLDGEIVWFDFNEELL